MAALVKFRPKPACQLFEITSFYTAPASLPARMEYALTSKAQPATLLAGKFAGRFTMSLAEVKAIEFFPPPGPPAGAAKIGFRFGDKGTHSSRTLMLTELEAVLAAAPGAADRAAYAAAIIEGNCLEKPTASTRRLSNQRLGELYALDPFVVVFRVLRGLWDVDPKARPLLAMLAALARDPLFMASAAPVLSQPAGIEIHRAPIREALRKLVGERMNDDTLDKVVRNVSSSWTQIGHLAGRTFKHRQRVSAPPTAVAFALLVPFRRESQGNAIFLQHPALAPQQHATFALVHFHEIGLLRLRLRSRDRQQPTFLLCSSRDTSTWLQHMLWRRTKGFLAPPLYLVLVLGRIRRRVRTVADGIGCAHAQARACEPRRYEMAAARPLAKPSLA